MQSFYKKTLQSYFSLFLLFIIPIGCQSIDSKQEALNPPPKMELEVTLASGDEIEVKFFYVPELNEIQTVRPDGKISLQLVGEVSVLDKTPLELKNELVKLYSSELKNPEVAVIVRSLSNQRVYVGGEVNAPGMIEIPRSMTALEAIMQAGGFIMETANIGKVLVIRNKDGQRSKELVNFKRAIEGEENAPAVYLQPLDIVYVPETKVTKYNRWVDQYINRIVPFGTTVTTTRGRTTMGIDPSN